MREKNKIKIVLSLLIAVAFMLPAASVMGSSVSIEKQASAINNGQFGQPELVTLNKDALVALDEDDGCYPVDITAISLGGIDHVSGDIIRTGTYPLDTDVCQTQFDPCIGIWTLVMVDPVQEGPAVDGSILMPIEIYMMTDGTNLNFRFNNLGPTPVFGQIDLHAVIDGVDTVYVFPGPIQNNQVVTIPLPNCCASTIVFWGYVYSPDMTGWNLFQQVPYPFGDFYPVTVKKFIDVYKLVEYPGNYTQDKVVDLYCEDFEDPCEINTNWATIDQPVFGANGALDTWTWSDKRYCSAGHSMHSTSFDQYLPNQMDTLQMIVPINVAAYDKVKVTFCMWIEGDAINIGNVTVPIMLIQDYGYFEYSFDTITWINPDGLYYNSNGATKTYSFNITLNNASAADDSIYVRFVWKSDAAFCYEGMYIDDVCFTGTIKGKTITPPREEWVWIHDSYDGPITFNTPCITNVFPDVWTVTEEGTYMICAWLEAIDDCHFSSTPVDDPYCIVIEIGNILDNEIDCTSLDITPVSPAWEGDDIISTIDVCNVGTLDETNKQVQMTVNRGTFISEFYTGFEGAVNVDNGDGQMMMKKWQNPGDPFITEWVTNWNPYPRSFFHYTTYDSSEGTTAIADFNNNEASPQPWLHSITATNDYVRGPALWKGTDKDSGITVTFDSKVNNGAGERLGFGVWDWTVGSGFFYTLTAYPTGSYWYDWTTISYDASALITSCMGLAGALPTDDICIGFYCYHNNDGNVGNAGCPWNGQWAGNMIDNINYESLVAGDEVIFQQTQVVPTLAIGDCETLTFTWPDAGVGQYVFTYEIITPDSNADNNICVQPYNVINTIECIDEWTCVDYTGPGQGHWVEESCCGGYFWPGDPATTMYGNNWNDAIYLKNATGGLNFNLLGGAVSIDFDTWFQISAGDVGKVQYSKDGGLTWWDLVAPYTGNSITFLGADTFGWLHPTLAVPGTGTAIMQFRFVFTSNATGVNRGWFVDNIRVKNGVNTVFGPDPCLDFTKFYRHEVQYGCWWTQPWIESFAYTHGDLNSGSGWVYASYPLNLWEPSWGCYDKGVFGGAYGNYPARPWNGAYPDNLNTAIIGTLDVPTAFYGWLSATTYYDMIDAGDVGYLEVSDDNGATWTVLTSKNGDYYFTATGGVHGSLDFKLKNDYVYWDSTPAALGGSPATYDLTEYLGAEQIKVRARFTSDSTNHGWREAGFGLLGPVCFTGMSDNNAPVTVAQMTGTFDEQCHWYTSCVKIKLTASDDISGVAKIYYTLDGVQYEYTQLVSICTDGTHTFCFWSVDNEGNVEEKQCLPEFRIDMSGPTVSITGPTAGALYIFGKQILELKSGKTIFLFNGIPVTATATANDNPVEVVRFYLDDVLLAEDSTAPYSASLSAKHTGPATIKVTAVDGLGREASDTMNIDNYMKLF